MGDSSMMGKKPFTWRWLRHLLWMIPSVLIGVPFLLYMAFLYIFLIHDWTVYSFHFDEEAFRTIEPGDSIDTLVDKVGSPLRMHYFGRHMWYYEGFQICFDARDRAYAKYIGEQRIDMPLMSVEEVLQEFGEPYPDSWQYDGFRVVFDSSHARAYRRYIQHPDGSETTESLDYLDMDRLRSMYGEPLSVSYPRPRYLQVWEYTQPGHLGRWADVTWHKRAVKVDLKKYQVVEVWAHFIRGGDLTDHPLDMRKPPLDKEE
jgi:hypothetical protein